jgi:hypothetical protein
MPIVNKKVTLELVGLDGNAFSLMGAFRQQARREKWAKEEINAVIDECKSSDYSHLLVTLMDHCQSPEINEDDDYDFEEEEDDEEYDQEELN